MFFSALFYAGVAALIFGGAMSFKVPGFPDFAAGRGGGWLAALGAAASFSAAAFPARTTRIARIGSRLDRFLPAYQFHEKHSIEIRASPERVDKAIREVTAGDILLFRTLTAIRRLGRAEGESILNAPGDRPILEVATRTGFLTLADQAGSEIVIGMAVIRPRGRGASGELTPESFAALQEPGFALAAMNFRLEERRAGCLLVTETRVFATDGPSCRKFGRYWRVIYPGSSLIRFQWLRAIKAKAEAPGAVRR